MATYTVGKLPGQAWAVTEADESAAASFYRTVAVCDRQEDAERIAYCLNVVEQSEETARRDEAVQS